MKNLTLTFVINDANCIKNIIFDINETDYPCNSDTIQKVCWAAIKAVNPDKPDIAMQDLLNELNIPRQ